MGCNIPLKSIQGVSYRLERYDLLEQVKTRLSFFCMREVGDARLASNDLLARGLGPERVGYPHGQETIETRAIPMTKANLTRKAMR